MSSLENKVALVTGGAAGLGLAIATRLANEGARVIISDVQADVGVAAAEKSNLSFREHDVTDEAQWKQIVAEIESRWGRLDILVNNAGILGPLEFASPVDVRLEDWKRVFAVNVEGTMLGCHVAVPAIARAGGGSIINISSTAALLATPFATAYGAAKAAVRHLTKSVAQYCAQERLNVRCNSVHPCMVRTEMWDKGTAEAARKRGVPFEVAVQEAQANLPLGALQEPEEVAGAVAYLASDDARNVTGTKMLVDGGMINCDTYLLHRLKERGV